MAVEPRADDAALPVPVQGVPCAGQAVQCLAVSAHAQSFIIATGVAAVVDAAQMDLGHVAALAGLGWIVGERTYHQAAFHLGHHHGYAAGCGGLVFVMRPGFRHLDATPDEVATRESVRLKKAAAGKGMGVEVCRRPTTYGWDGRGTPQVAERQT